MSTPDLDAAETNAPVSCYPRQVHYKYVAKGATIIVTKGTIDLCYREGRLSWLLGDAGSMRISVSDGSAFVMPCAAMIGLSTSGTKAAAFLVEGAERVVSVSWTGHFVSKWVASCRRLFLRHQARTKGEGQREDRQCG